MVTHGRWHCISQMRICTTILTWIPRTEIALYFLLFRNQRHLTVNEICIPTVTKTREWYQWCLKDKALKDGTRIRRTFIAKSAACFAILTRNRGRWMTATQNCWNVNSVEIDDDFRTSRSKQPVNYAKRLNFIEIFVAASREFLPGCRRTPRIRLCNSFRTMERGRKLREKEEPHNRDCIQ